MGDSFTIILLQLQQFSAAKLKEAQTPCLAGAVSSLPAPLMGCPPQAKPEVAKVMAERAKIAKKNYCAGTRDKLLARGFWTSLRS
ncbi:hypothetical protein SAMN05216404_10795 [Nitrosospira multiformis]|uniref:Uncharacterized protein n=1 Tax=Nitrosospira multiformis TaxID=1231 RepID=A0A1H8JJ94_9PROT|nr:hypothetical protein SAMN05216404_10795 [Nitrosospira multiformis]